MNNDYMSKLPIKDQEKYNLAMARRQVLDSVKPDLDLLSQSVRNNIEAQISSLDKEDTTRILSILLTNPAESVIGAINDGAFSSTNKVVHKNNKFSISGLLATFFSNLLSTNQTETQTTYKKGFEGDVSAVGPSHLGPSFTASAEASESKASAFSDDVTGRSGAKTDQSSGQAVVYGRGTAASSTTTVRGNVTFQGSETKFGNINIRNK